MWTFSILCRREGQRCCTLFHSEQIFREKCQFKSKHIHPCYVCHWHRECEESIYICSFRDCHSNIGSNVCPSSLVWRFAFWEKMFWRFSESFGLGPWISLHEIHIYFEISCPTFWTYFFLKKLISFQLKRYTKDHFYYQLDMIFIVLSGDVCTFHERTWNGGGM